MADFVGHEPCPECGSRDNLARYSDGSAHCFGCKHNIRGDGSEGRRRPKVEGEFEPKWVGDYKDLPTRGLREETLRKWGYQVGTDKQIMNYRDEQGVLRGQKIRMAGKKFVQAGDCSDLLYGMWLWGKGKSIVITEGELDALSVSQAFELKWPVVSLPGGAGSVRKTIKRCYDYLSGFERIVLMFDNDEPGHEAVDQAVELLPVGRVCIARLPEKDASDTLVKHGPGPIVRAFWDAVPYRPDGIVSGSDIELSMLRSAAVRGYSVEYPDLQSKLLGLRKGEITLFTAGSGIGKSTLVRQLCFHLHQAHNCTIGNVYLEEANVKTAQAYVALHANVPLGKLRYDPSCITPAQWEAGYEATIKDRMWFYDHFGSLESSRLISKLHYMATVLKCDFIALDHVSIVTSGLESSSEGERKDIDILMTKLRQLVEETGVGILGVVHLKRAKDKSFNEGSEVSLSDLRGSASLEQLSDNVISMERDQQDADKRDISTLRVLKCRETGDTGRADVVAYSRSTGRLETRTALEAEEVGF